MLQLQKRHAKAAKDALKALGFLDRRCRVPPADRSDAEVALPLTPSGAAGISSLTHHLSDSKDGVTCSEVSRTAPEGCICSSNGLSHDASRLQVATSPLSVSDHTVRAAHYPALQPEHAVLMQLLEKGLARLAGKRAVARNSATTPGHALQEAMRRLLANTGMRNDSQVFDLQ